MLLINGYNNWRVGEPALYSKAPSEVRDPYKILWGRCCQGIQGILALQLKYNTTFRCTQIVHNIHLYKFYINLVSSRKTAPTLPSESRQPVLWGPNRPACAVTSYRPAGWRIGTTGRYWQGRFRVSAPMWDLMGAGTDSTHQWNKLHLYLDSTLYGILR